jgi:hypothetical protein
MALGMSACVQIFVNLTLRVTSSQSSDQQCSHVSFSESGHRSGSRSSVAGFVRSNCQTVSRAHDRTEIEEIRGEGEEWRERIGGERGLETKKTALKPRDS